MIAHGSENLCSQAASAAKGDVDVNLDVLGGFGKELNEKSKKTKDSIEVKVEI